MPDIDFGDAKSTVAVVTLWSDRTKLMPKLQGKYHIIGNLYSSNGINYMLQTLLAFPSIRYLIVWGFSLTKSDADLVTLWEKGVEKGKIPGTKISILLDPAHVDLVRRNVRIVDLRGRPSTEIAKVIDELPVSEPWGEPMQVQLHPESVVETIPSPLSGHHIYEESVFGAWVKSLNYIMKFGNMKESEYGIRQKEYNNLMVTIGKNYDFIEYGFKEQFTAEDLEEYSDSLMSPDKQPGLSYTYGERLMDYRGNDQIAYIIRKLGASPNSRRAVAVLWDPLIDQEQPHGPCLNFISFNIHNDELFASIVFRSHDLFKAWPKNVLGLMRLQRHVVDRINERHGMRLKPGRFTVISISAHIYEQDFADAKAVVDQHLSIIQRLNVDPKGLFVVDIETGTIRVEYRSNAGELLQVFEGKNGEDLYQQIANNDIFSFFVHSAYLGYQISKAESCLNDGRPYVQDAAPDS